MATEIERTFLIEDAADAKRRASRSARIEQGYLALTDDGVQVRVRRIDDHCVLTVKRGTGESRFEEEIEIEPRQFESLWPLSEGRRVFKTRLYVESERTAEVDVFEADLDGLVVVEVEFDSVRDSESFEPPSWFGREVTGDQRYANTQLALEGKPR